MVPVIKTRKVLAVLLYFNKLHQSTYFKQTQTLKKKKDKRKKTRKIYLQSVAMPTKIHFLKRHSWH